MKHLTLLTLFCLAVFRLGPTRGIPVQPIRADAPPLNYTTSLESDELDGVVSVAVSNDGR